MAQNRDRPVSSPGGAPSAPSLRAGVTGTARGADGSPIVGAAVLALALSRPAPPVPEMAATTDAHGRYTWALPPGRYQLRLVPLLGVPMVLEVVVAAGRVSTLDFQLAPSRR